MIKVFQVKNYWYARGLECFNKKEYEIAIRCFSRSLECDKNNEFDAWFMKGNSFYQLRQYDEAIKCFNKSVSEIQSKM